MSKANPDVTFQVGQKVTVRGDCPFTLPAYARSLEGIVVGTTEEGLVRVEFGPDRHFPIAGACLQLIE